MMLPFCVFGFSKQHWDWIRPWSTVNLFASFIVWFAPVGLLLSRLNCRSNRVFLREKLEVLFLLLQAHFLQIFVLRCEVCLSSEKLFMLHLKFFTLFLQFFTFLLLFLMLFFQFFIFFFSNFLFLVHAIVCLLYWMASNSWCLLCSLWSIHEMSLCIFSCRRFSSTLLLQIRNITDIYIYICVCVCVCFLSFHVINSNF